MREVPHRERLALQFRVEVGDHVLLVGGEGEHEVFAWLKGHLPLPSDDSVSMMANPKFIIWQPVKRSDVAWNFEKFLIDSRGVAFKRYSKKYQTSHISNDIDQLVGQM